MSVYLFLLTHNDHFIDTESTWNGLLINLGSSEMLERVIGSWSSG